MDEMDIETAVSERLEKALAEQIENKTLDDGVIREKNAQTAPKVIGAKSALAKLTAGKIRKKAARVSTKKVAEISEEDIDDAINVMEEFGGDFVPTADGSLKQVHYNYNY